VLTFASGSFLRFSITPTFPWIKPAQKIFEDGALPFGGVKLELLKLTIEKLTSTGYVYIGNGPFCAGRGRTSGGPAPEDPSAEFSRLQHPGRADIYAFGMSSISQADSIYWQNQKELPVYYGELDQGRRPIAKSYLLTEDDRIRRVTIMRLMCDLGVDFAALSKTLGIDFENTLPRTRFVGRSRK